VITVIGEGNCLFRAVAQGEARLPSMVSPPSRKRTRTTAAKNCAQWQRTSWPSSWPKIVKNLHGPLNQLKVPSTAICFACLNLVSGAARQRLSCYPTTNRGLHVAPYLWPKLLMWVRARVQNPLSSIPNCVFPSLCAFYVYVCTAPAVEFKRRERVHRPCVQFKQP